MANPVGQAGAVSVPSRYAALTMGARQFTGLWTQRSPFRDAATPYLVAKFYSGSRFDSIWDGINREISQLMTDVRPPGSVVYNSNTFPAALSFGNWKYLQNNAEVIRVLMDGKDANIYDATAGQKSTLLAKSAGAGAARMLGINTELFIGDGVDQKKIVAGSATWRATTTIAPGQLINTGGIPGFLQMALGGVTIPVLGSSSDGTNVYIFFDPQQVPSIFPNLVGATITLSGFTVKTTLNGAHQAVRIISTTLGILTINVTVSSYAFTAEGATAKGTTGNGITGGSAPSFSTTEFAVVADSGQQWKCYGPSVENWGLDALTTAPILTPINGTQYWMPKTSFPQFSALLDPEGNIETALAPGGVSGSNYPSWADFNSEGNWGNTTDGTVIWQNIGPAGTWNAATSYGVVRVPGPSDFFVIVDSNGNLQWATTSGTSGGSEPTWATNPGDPTTDGGITWTCLGAGVTLSTGSLTYSYSTHGIDGSVSTASPTSTIQGPILVAQADVLGVSRYINIMVAIPNDTQIDQAWIWRTPQGESDLIREDQVETDGLLANNLVYFEYGIPDVSLNGGGALNAFVAAPIADANDPPPVGALPQCYCFQRLWYIVNNTVCFTGGPDTVVGNGNTACPPVNEIPFPAQPIRVVPVMVQNGGLLVFTTDGVWIILGGGSPGNSFYTTPYFLSVSILNYNAVDVYNNAVFVMESNRRVSTLAIEYPFNPQTGYTEFGFPIGDQFRKVTTGGISSNLYDAATAFVSWNIANSGDTGMYVADGAVGWFRMSIINAPESGMLWSPRRAIAGGTSAVQNVETGPGINSLLMGPPSGTPGPILTRDQSGTVFADNGTPYAASWNAKGVNLLCGTGETVEVAHVSTKCVAVGARPTISVLFGEIQPSSQRPYTVLTKPQNDPPDTPKSVSYFSDRYVVLDGNGRNSTGDCVLVKFDFGTQVVGDGLLDWGIFARSIPERQEQADKA